METYTTSVGVELEVLPVPYREYLNWQAKAMSLFPDPVPPTKEVKTVTGPETVEDLEDEGYKAAKRKAERDRNEYVSERILKWCVNVKAGVDEAVIAELEADSDILFPQPARERVLAYLSRYALRTTVDFSTVTTLAVTQTLVSDKEVRDRVASFRGKVAQPTGNDVDAPGAPEAQRVDVPSEVS